MNSTVKKIAIAGIGGIGGFTGAPLASYYSKSDKVSVIFICRGETKDIIAERGLTLESGNEVKTVFPDLVSDDPVKIGELDVLIIATKSYTIKSILDKYRDCIRRDTILITLQNMVNAHEEIKETVPDKGKILEGCIYVASNVKQKGWVRHMGGPGKIFIGGQRKADFEWVIKLLQDGGWDVTFEERIKEVLWKKFLFVAPVAAVTSAYNITFGQLLESKRLMEVLEKMIKEIQQLARVSNISISDEDIKTVKGLLTKFPYQAKSSLQLDFEEGKPTEKQFLVDYVIDNCLLHGIDASAYRDIEKKIASRYP